MSSPLDIIRLKRSGNPLTRESLLPIFQDYNSGLVPDRTMAALLMVMACAGMDQTEVVALTQALQQDTQAWDLSGLPGPAVELSSLGAGIERMLLIAAPIVATTGICLPLQHSGEEDGYGGLNALKAIPGLKPSPSFSSFAKVVNQTGVGYREQRFPGESLIRQLRELQAVTATDSLYTDTAFLLSRMQTAAHGLVFHFPCLQVIDSDLDLAAMLVNTVSTLGKRSIALFTDAHQPFGQGMGATLEITETQDILRGQGSERLATLALELASLLIWAGEGAASLETAKQLARHAIASGAALDKWQTWIEAQGGNAAVVEDPSLLPQAPQTKTLEATEEGYVTEIRVDVLQDALSLLGESAGGAKAKAHLGAGLQLHVELGSSVGDGDRLCTCFGLKPSQIEAALTLLPTAFRIEPEPLRPPDLLKLLVTPTHR
jgi:pyrimidine-nucleoside phosphorylase